MPSSASYAESQSSLTQRRKQWLATLISSVLFSLFAGSVLGLTLSALAFSSATDIEKPGYAITQSFVLFASMLSLFYIPLHVIASHKGEGLYLDLPIPSFRHQTHARTTLVIRMAVVMWASAIVGLALNISHQEGGMDSSTVIRLDLDMFACAAGFLSGSVMLLVLQFATRPFALPWITPQPVFDEDASTGASRGSSSAFGDDEKSSGGGSSSTDSSTLCGTPPASAKRPKTAASAPATTTPPPSDASSSASSRAREMTRTRRYVLEAPTPVPLSSPASSSSASSEGESASLPSASDSGSLSAASTVASSPEQPGKKGAGKKGEGRPITPETDGGGGPGGKGAARQGPQRPPAIAATWVRRRPADSPSMFRFRSKSVPQPAQCAKKIGGGDGGGDGGGGSGSGQTAPGKGGAVPPEPSPAALPPPPTYYVPGSWVLRGQYEEGEEDGV